VTARTRRRCALICAFWVLVALVRMVAWTLGYPGDPVSLVLAALSGAVAAVGLAAFGARGGRS
jgi:polyferredoxin